MKIRKFTINTQNLITRQLCNGNGKCAVGWYLSACGVSNAELEQNDDICYDVIDATIGERAAQIIAHINDSVAGTKRERMLRRAFASIGIAVHFE